jgi:glycosyltransferase involved in cell wall biosynthesis
VEAEGERQKAEGGSKKLKIESRKSKVGSPQAEVDITVYTTLANGKEELPYQNGDTKTVDGVKVKYFKRITKDHSHFSPSLLSHLWKNVRQFDVIHIHSWWNLVGMGGVLICLLRGIRPIVSPRGMLGDYTFNKTKLIFHNMIGQHLLRKCIFHATTKMEAEEIAVQVFGDIVNIIDLMGEGEKKQDTRCKIQDTRDERTKLESAKYKDSRGKKKEETEKIFVIHNIVKLPESLPIKTRNFDGTLKLIFLSRIHHKKGIELLLNTLSSINFPFQLSIVGEGEIEYVESLKQKAKNLKIDQYINWIGAVYGEEKYRLLADHDAFILPSYNENFANVVIEAIAVNTPVLLSEHVGLKDYVAENNFGLVFKLDEIKLILEKIQSLLLANQSAFYFKKQMISDDLTLKYLEMYQSQLKH